jgi:suppressor of tumorigenicity protein 13
MAKIPPQHVSQLKVFTDLLKADPSLLHSPELSFFKDYIESLGGKVPPAQKAPPSWDVPKTEIPTPPKSSQPEPDVVGEQGEELIESDVEFDNTGVIGEQIYTYTFVSMRTTAEFLT